MANEERIAQLKQQLEGFMTRLDNMDPEETSVEDIDQLIHILESMEEKLR
ncbi:SE1561 family protein [Sediminibacillus massiliensis]|nr:SE1561 family protein [Sediminibacillus massiliensis]